MNSFSEAYKNSKENFAAGRRALIEQQHAQIVNAVKRNEGIDRFDTLSESERQSYSSMILKLWNKETGITKLGQEYLAEAAKGILTPDSTPEQIEKSFKKSAKASVSEIVRVLASKGDSCIAVTNIKTRIESQIEKKLPASQVKEWLLEIVQEYIAGAVRSCKF